MKIYKWLLLTLILLIPIFSACGGNTPAEGGGTPASGDAAASNSTESGLAKELNVYNWADYIDEEVIKNYEKEYGIKITYDTFASNEDMLAKLQAGATGYDVIFPSSYVVPTLSELGLLAEIDHNNIPNLKNIDPLFLNIPDDPDNKYCVPYQWGTTGIGYRKDVFGEEVPDSWAYLFEPEMAKKWAEAGGINILNDQREVIGAALKYLGYSLNDTDEAHLQQAKELILKVKPYIKSFNSEDYDESLLVSSEVVISHAWNGDVAQAASKTVDEATGESPWAYAVPKEGGFIWADQICVTASSPRKATAEHFINYLLEAKNGAAITNYTYYASPNVAAKEFILPEILNDPGIYPPQEVIDKMEWGAPLGDAVFIYDRIWTEIKSQ